MLCFAGCTQEARTGQVPLLTVDPLRSSTITRRRRVLSSLTNQML